MRALNDTRTISTTMDLLLRLQEGLEPKPASHDGLHDTDISESARSCRQMHGLRDHRKHIEAMASQKR